MTTIWLLLLIALVFIGLSYATRTRAISNALFFVAMLALVCCGLICALSE